MLGVASMLEREVSGSGGRGGGRGGSEGKLFGGGAAEAVLGECVDRRGRTGAEAG